MGWGGGRVRAHLAVRHHRRRAAALDGVRHRAQLVVHVLGALLRAEDAVEVVLGGVVRRRRPRLEARRPQVDLRVAKAPFAFCFGLFFEFNV